MDATDDPTSANAAAPSADDMLAQLASDDIDRLLAEAEQAPQSPAAAKGIAAPSAQPAPPTPDAVDAATQSFNEVDDRLADLVEEPVTSEASAPAFAPQLSDGRSAEEEISRLLAKDAPEKPPAAEPAHSATATETAAASTPPGAAASSSAPSAAKLAHPPSVLPTQLGDPQELSLSVRLLDWILAPLESIPDGLRNVMGIVAVVTLVNALALISYVKVVRVRHATPSAALARHAVEHPDRSSARSASDDQSRKHG